MIRIETFTFNPFLENTFVVFDDSGDALIIDPGCYEKYEEDQLQDFVRKNNLRVSHLVNTHSHIDHCLGNYWVKETFKVPLLLHEAEELILRSVDTYAPSYGFEKYRGTLPDDYLREGQKFKFGVTEFDVLFVPGHSPGHIALVNKEENICLSGDVLFKNSIGRTDLPGGNYDTLLQSIREKLFDLPDSVVVYSGHGEKTTIGEEKITNPFCGEIAMNQL